jgi:hypothetical protein
VRVKLVLDALSCYIVCFLKDICSLYASATRRIDVVVFLKKKKKILRGSLLFSVFYFMIYIIPRYDEELAYFFQEI